MIDALVRVLGGEPRTVRLLARAFARAARGRMELEIERRGSGMDPDTVRVLVASLLALLSMGTAAVVAGFRDFPSLVVFLVAAPVGLVAYLVALQRGALTVLEDDDARCMGWWPVSLRDLTLARIAVVLRPTLEAGALLSALPLLAHAATGPIPVVSATGLAAGLLLEIVSTSLLVTVGLVWLRQRFGRERAERALVAIMVAVGCAVAAATVYAPSAKTLPESLAPPEAPAWAPPTWFAAWGLLPSQPRRAAGGVAASLALGLVLAPLALRMVASRRSGERLAVAAARPRRAPFVALTCAVLAPMMRSREGWCVRRLLAAHLRDDWHRAALGAWPLLVVAALGSAVLAPASTLARVAHPGPPLFVRVVLPLFLVAEWLPVALVVLLASSRDHRASWVVRQAELSSRLLRAAVRTVGRVLLLVPLLGAIAILHVRAGSPPSLALSDGALAVLIFELALRLAQIAVPAPPFSRAWDAPLEESLVAAAVLVVPASATLALAIAILHDRSWPGRLALWTALLAGIVAAGRRLGAADRAIAAEDGTQAA